MDSSSVTLETIMSTAFSRDKCLFLKNHFHCQNIIHVVRPKQNILGTFNGSNSIPFIYIFEKIIKSVYNQK